MTHLEVLSLSALLLHNYVHWNNFLITIFISMAMDFEFGILPVCIRCGTTQAPQIQSWLFTMHYHDMSGKELLESCRIDSISIQYNVWQSSTHFPAYM